MPKLTMPQVAHTVKNIYNEDRGPHNSISHENAEEIINLFLSEVEKEIKMGNQIGIRGFGVFERAIAAAKDFKIRGRGVKKEARYKIKFRPSRALNKRIAETK